MKILEFRSDTFTKPTPAMRRAMAEAEVGDDQYGEDPTVNKLEKRAAESVGKEAGLYVASGMMGNLCGVLSQTQRGDEVILGDLAHIYQNEMDAAFVLGGIVPRLVPNREGLPALDDIAHARAHRAHLHRELAQQLRWVRHHGRADECDRRAGTRTRHTRAPRRRADLQRRRGARR